MYAYVYIAIYGLPGRMPERKPSASTCSYSLITGYFMVPGPVGIQAKQGPSPNEAAGIQARSPMRLRAA